MVLAAASADPLTTCKYRTPSNARRSSAMCLVAPVGTVTEYKVDS